MRRATSETLAIATIIMESGFQTMTYDNIIVILLKRETKCVCTAIIDYDDKLIIGNISGYILRS